MRPRSILTLLLKTPLDFTQTRLHLSHQHLQMLIWMVIQTFSSARGGDTLIYIQNIGDAVVPFFDSPLKSPFGLQHGTVSFPTFIDIDGDGDMDMFSRSRFGLEMRFFENTLINAIAEPETVGWELTIAPNPTSEHLQVQITGSQLSQPIEIQVENLHGQRVKPQQQITSLPNSTFQIDISGLPAGTYLLKAKTEHGILTRRFVVL